MLKVELPSLGLNYQIWDSCQGWAPKIELPKVELNKAEFQEAKLSKVNLQRAKFLKTNPKINMRRLKLKVLVQVDQNNANQNKIIFYITLILYSIFSLLTFFHSPIWLRYQKAQLEPIW